MKFMPLSWYLCTSLHPHLILLEREWDHGNFGTKLRKIKLNLRKRIGSLDYQTVCLCLCAPIPVLNKWTFTKFVTNVTPFDSTPTLYFWLPTIGNNNMADPQNCEIVPTVESLNTGLETPCCNTRRSSKNMQLF